MTSDAREQPGHSPMLDFNETATITVHFCSNSHFSRSAQY